MDPYHQDMVLRLSRLFHHRLLWGEWRVGRRASSAETDSVILQAVGAITGFLRASILASFVAYTRFDTSHLLSCPLGVRSPMAAESIVAEN